MDNSFNKRVAYFIIECKSINGNKILNEKYVNEGVKRFITKKYSSYYGKNLMLEFIVKDISIKHIAIKIEHYQNNLSKLSMHGKFEYVYEKNILFVPFSILV